MLRQRIFLFQTACNMVLVYFCDPPAFPQEQPKDYTSIQTRKP